MKYHNLDFPEALKNLAGRYQIELPERKQSAQEQERERLRKRMFAVNEKAVAIFRDYLIKSPKAAVARHYLEKRQAIFFSFFLPNSFFDCYTYIEIKKEQK